MRQFVFLTLAAVIIAVVHANEKKAYTTRFDNVNVDQILNNERILNSYIKCLLEKGPCTSEGRELKKTLPDAFRTNCDKCSDSQRRNARKVIFHLQDKKQADYAKLVAKYDPEGVYREAWKKENQKN